MDKLDTYKQQLEKELADDSKPWTKYFKLLEEKTNLPKIYIFLGKQKPSYVNRLLIISMLDSRSTRLSK